MARPLRIQFPSAFYHVMNRGLDHRDIFFDEKDCVRFLCFLAESVDRFQLKIFAFCLMKNHYHLCLQTHQENLSRAMQYINGRYAESFNTVHHRDGPLFRGRYKSIVIQNDPYLLQVVRYIHLNPVKAGLVDDPAQYQWSSHWYYLSRRYNGKHWLSFDDVLGQFSHITDYERFVAQGNEKSLESFYERSKWKPILGDDSFVAEILPHVHLSSEHSRYDKTPQFLSLSDVVRSVSLKRSVSFDQLFGHQQGISTFERDFIVYISNRYAGFSVAEIKNFFCINASAISKACRRVKIRLSQDFLLQSQMEEILYVK